MNRRRNWSIAVVVSAAAGFFALQNGLAPADHPPTASHTIIATESAKFTPVHEGCSFMWAYHDDAELTKQVDAAVRALDPLASANASLFGEDCVYADGHSTFSTMETDFYVRRPVQDLNDEEAFGIWMRQVLHVILQIPPEQIQQAGNLGFVEFWFVISELENLVVQVPIYQYRNEASEKSGAELFQFFYNNQ